MTHRRFSPLVVGQRSSKGLGRAIAVLLFVGAAVLSCSQVILGNGDDEDGGTGADMNRPIGVPSLRIVPDNDVLLVDLNQTGTKDFSVLLIAPDGTKTDVTSQVTLTLDNASIGQLSGKTFTSSQLAANKVDFTHVKATYQDLAASANLTVVWLRMSGPAQDFFYNLPYMGEEQSQPLSFQTFIQSIDSFFAVDTTGSMTAQIKNLNSSLANTIIPAVKRAAAKEAWFGVGAIEDFPVWPFGSSGVYAGNPDDQPFILLSAMQASVTTAQQAVRKLLNSAGTGPRGAGGDTPEGQMEALYQIATGAGNQVTGIVNIPPHRPAGTIGGVEFRPGAFPVITLITDAAFHAKDEARYCGGEAIDYSGTTKTVAHTRAEAEAALKKICAKVIGVSAEVPGRAPECIGTNDLTQFAQATGAQVPPAAWGAPAQRPANCALSQCCTGINGAGESPVGGLCPLVFKVQTDGNGLGNQIVSGITNLALYSSFDVLTNLSGSTSGENGAMIESGHTSADFIKSIQPDSATASPPPTSKLPAKTPTGFTDVVPGAEVRFKIQAQNDFQAPRDVPQVFHATIKILAGGCTDLDQRDVIILIPPAAPPVVG